MPAKKGTKRTTNKKQTDKVEKVAGVAEETIEITEASKNIVEAVIEDVNIQELRNYEEEEEI